MVTPYGTSYAVGAADHELGPNEINKGALSQADHDHEED